MSAEPRCSPLRRRLACTRPTRPPSRLAQRYPHLCRNSSQSFENATPDSAWAGACTPLQAAGRASIGKRASRLSDQRALVGRHGFDAAV
ncbi:hypothetical protein DP42_5191 [Burkholderia pseudomallei]|nr:hypothetical protein DP42_5191 [Burkholderia pseudomallei]